MARPSPSRLTTVSACEVTIVWSAVNDTAAKATIEATRPTIGGNPAAMTPPKMRTPRIATSGRARPSARRVSSETARTTSSAIE